MNKKNKNKGLSLIEVMIAIVITSLLSTTAYFTYQTQTLKTQIAEVMAQSQNHLTHLVAQKQLKRITDLNYKIDNLESKILKDSEVKNGQLFLVLDPQKFNEQNLIVFRTSDEANHFDCYTNINKVNISNCSNLEEENNDIIEEDEYVSKLKQLLRGRHIYEFRLQLENRTAEGGSSVSFFYDNDRNDGKRRVVAYNEDLLGWSADMNSLDGGKGENWGDYSIIKEVDDKNFDDLMNIEHHINSIYSKLNEGRPFFTSRVKINGEYLEGFRGPEQRDGGVRGEEFKNALNKKIDEIYNSVY